MLIQLSKSNFYSDVYPLLFDIKYNHTHKHL